MGYAKTLEIGDNATFGGVIYPNITITTVATEKTIGQIIVPSFNGVVKHAYIDVFIGRITDTSGAENYIDGATTITLQGQTVAAIIDLSFTVGANATVSGCTILGTADLASYVGSGSSPTVKLHSDTKAKGNNLILRDIVCQCRLTIQ